MFSIWNNVRSIISKIGNLKFSIAVNQQNVNKKQSHLTQTKRYRQKKTTKLQNSTPIKIDKIFQPLDQDKNTNYNKNIITRTTKSNLSTKKKSSW